MRDPALQQAIDAMGQRNGNLAALAAQLGVTTQALSQWRQVPPRRVLDVERITGIERHILRPDIYPPPPNQMQEEAAA